MNIVVNAMFFRVFSRKRSSVGKEGENIAVEYLKKCGYLIIDRNYSNSTGYKLGEIDIVASEKQEIVFVEVKSSTQKDKGQDQLPPETNITFQKIKKLERIAEIYLRDKHKTNASYRFDAISVIFLSDNRHVVKHIKNMFL